MWDVTDFVVPPTENSAFFVTTNVIITPNQTQGACAEDPSVSGGCDPAHPEKNCSEGRSLVLGHGVETGKCVRVSNHFLGHGKSNPTHSCEVLAWCPVEKDEKPLGNKKALLAAAANFTVLIKNQVCFT